MEALYQRFANVNGTINLIKLEATLINKDKDVLTQLSERGENLLHYILNTRGKQTSADTHDKILEPEALRDVERAVQLFCQHAPAKYLQNTAEHNWTLLHTACRYGTPTMVKSLLQSGAAPSLTVGNHKDYQPIHLVSSAGSPEMLHTLLKYGGNQQVTQSVLKMGGTFNIPIRLHPWVMAANHNPHKEWVQSLKDTLILYGDDNYHEAKLRKAAIKEALSTAGELFFNEFKLRESELQKLTTQQRFAACVKPYLESKDIRLPDELLKDIFFPQHNPQLKLVVNIPKITAEQAPIYKQIINKRKAEELSGGTTPNKQSKRQGNDSYMERT